MRLQLGSRCWCLLLVALLVIAGMATGGTPALA